MATAALFLVKNEENGSAVFTKKHVPAPFLRLFIHLKNCELSCHISAAGAPVRPPLLQGPGPAGWQRVRRAERPAQRGAAELRQRGLPLGPIPRAFPSRDIGQLSWVWRVRYTRLHVRPGPRGPGGPAGVRTWGSCFGTCSFFLSAWVPWAWPRSPFSPSSTPSLMGSHVHSRCTCVQRISSLSVSKTPDPAFRRGGPGPRLWAERRG